MAKSSINFKAVKSNSETHNYRKVDYDYVDKSLTRQNENWQSKSIAESRAEIERFVKNHTGRKLQKKSTPIMEGVVLIKPETTMQDLKNLAKELKRRFGIEVIQIHTHRDEGHHDKDTGEWKPNLHAHLVAEWIERDPTATQTKKRNGEEATTKAIGKTLKLNKKDLSDMQTITANTLGMERGEVGSSREHVNSLDYKIQEKRKDIETQEKRLRELEQQIEEHERIRAEYLKYKAELSEREDRLKALDERSKELDEELKELEAILVPWKKKLEEYKNNKVEFPPAEPLTPEQIAKINKAVETQVERGVITTERAEQIAKQMEVGIITNDNLQAFRNSFKAEITEGEQKLKEKGRGGQELER